MLKIQKDKSNNKNRSNSSSPIYKKKIFQNQERTTKTQVEEYNDLNQIASNIIEIVKTELNSINSESLLSHLVEITQNFQNEIIPTVNYSQYENSELQQVITKNINIISNFFIKCLHIVDKVKSNSLDNLSTCLTQLFQIISKELNLNDRHLNTSNQQDQMHITAFNLFSKEEHFVCLINLLSSSIKQYFKTAKIIIKESSLLIENALSLGSKYKKDICSLNIQINMQNIKNKITPLYENINTLIEINQEIANKFNILNVNGEKFYSEAKEVFKNLKILHSEKLTMVKNTFEEYNDLLTEQQMYTKIPLNTHNIYKSKKDMNRKGSVPPKRKRPEIEKELDNTSKSIKDISFYNQQNERHILSKSSSQIIKTKKINTEKIKNHHLIVPIKINKKNISKTENNSNNQSTYGNSTQQNISNNQMSILSELSEKNKELQKEIITISSENTLLKRNLSNFIQSYDKIITEKEKKEGISMKSKSLINIMNKSYNEIINDHNENQNQKLEIDNIPIILSEKVISFIKNMKQLQNSIIKKEANIPELKKNFEIQKNELFNFANSVINGNLTFNKHQSMKNLNSNKFIILNTKESTETTKVNTIASKLNKDTIKSKKIPNPLKIIDYENKINIIKKENEQLKTTITGKEKEIKKLKTENKKKIISLQIDDNKELEYQKEKENQKKIINDLNIKIKLLNEEVINTKKANDDNIKNIQIENEQKNKEINMKLNLKIEEVNKLESIKKEIEKENNNYQNKILSLNKDINQLEILNKNLKEENAKFKLNNKLQEEKEETNEIKNQNAKLQSEIISLKDEIKKISNELNEMKKKEENLINDFKDKMNIKENEISDLKKNVNSLSKLSENIPNKTTNEIIVKKESNPQINFHTELMELSNMIKTIHSLLYEKQKQFNLKTSPIELKEKKDDSILSNLNVNSINNDISDITSSNQLTLFIDKYRLYYNEINKILSLLFELIEKRINYSNAEIKANLNSNEQKDNPKEHKKSSNDNNNEEKIKKLNDQNKYLINCFNECTITVIDSIKQMSPHLLDEENDINLNIIPDEVFIYEKISLAISKFKSYNKELNVQLKKIVQEKEELEKEAQRNLVKANAYKTALDEAINKINTTNEEKENNDNNYNDNISTSNRGDNIIKEEERPFTVEDLENPQNEQNDTKSNKKDNIKPTKDIIKIKNNLLSIQADLMHKISLKETECQKHESIINKLIQINKKIQEGKDKLLISAEKYNQLNELYMQEKNKNKELFNSYSKFITQFSEFVEHCKDNSNEIKKNVLTLGNDEVVSEEDYIIPRKHNNKLIQSSEKKNTFSEYIKSNKVDYIGMLNKNNSSGLNEKQMKDIISENIRIEEQNELLIMQLNEVKKELKETIAQNEKLMQEYKYKNINQEESIIGTLKDALEKLINEIQLNAKVKEFLTIILRVVGYSDDKIITIYQQKENKKGLFKMFK